MLTQQEKVLDALDELGLANNTIVVLLGPWLASRENTTLPVSII